MQYTTGDKQLIKKINTTLILQTLQERGPMSRADIAKVLGLTPATVSNNISQLIERKIVKEVGKGDSSGGRTPVLVYLDEKGVFFIGVDIHKDGVEAGIVNILGEIILSKEETFPIGASFEEEVQNCISELRAEFHHEDSIIGIGIGMHGIIDTERSISIFVPAMARRNMNLKQYIEETQKLPVFIENDSNAMALGEGNFGVAKGVQNYVFLNVGRGIGAGVVLDGKIFHGGSFAAGEIGHIHVQENGVKCVCGKYGCLDTVATEYTLIRDVIFSLQTKRVRLNKAMEEDLNLNHVNLEKIKQWAEGGDEDVLTVIRNMGRHIGRACSYIVNILNPEMLILGGSVSVLGEFMIHAIRETVEEFSLEEALGNLRVETSGLLEKTGVVGAASLVMHNMLKN